jgi:hypothetical protein
MPTIQLTVELDVKDYSGDEARKHARHFAAYALVASQKDYFPGTITKVRVTDSELVKE